MKEIKMPGFNGQPIHCYLWDEVENPKAVAQISHGMCEHAGRYDEMARRLNAAGYIVFADDHRAHGKTETDENRGNHKGDIFDRTLRDLICFNKILSIKYELPTVFVGHSYGSFLGQAFLESDTRACAVALTGTAYMNGKQAGLGLLWPLELFAKDWRPSFVNKATNLLFSPKYKGDHGPAQWVMSDLERRKEYEEDPLADIPVSINFDWSMLKSFGRLYTPKNLAKIKKDMPVAIFSGEDDPIGGHKSRDAVKLARVYEDHGLRDVSLHVYPKARHELFNEYCREDFYQDLIDFFDKALEKREKTLAPAAPQEDADD